MRGRRSASVAIASNECGSFFIFTQEGGAVKRKASDDAARWSEVMPSAKRRAGEEGLETTAGKRLESGEKINLGEKKEKRDGQKSHADERQVRETGPLKEGEEVQEVREKPSPSQHAKSLALARLCAWALALFSYDRVCHVCIVSLIPFMWSVFDGHIYSAGEVVSALWQEVCQGHRTYIALFISTLRNNDSAGARTCFSC